MSFTTSFAAATKKVVILPVDIPSEASSYSIYPNTLSLISADVANSLIREYGFDVLDTTKAQKVLLKAGLYKKYKEFIRLYKEKYEFDNDFISKISDTLEVDNIVFVSGGFDTQKQLFKQTIVSKLGFPGMNRLNPSYQLNLMVTLVNANNSIKLYEGTFQHDFKIEDFNMPSQYFGENSASIDKIKNYSQKISRQISYQIYANVKPDQSGEKADDYTVVKSTKGILTKDGRQNVTETTKKDLGDVKNLIDNKKRDYKNWVLKQL
jgi:hypothetical protein